MQQKVIYKYGLNVGRTTMLLPSESEILKVGVQGDDIFMWVEHDTIGFGTILDEKTFQVRGTGSPYEKRIHDQHLETVMIGPLVWHVFEVSPEI